MDEVNGVTKQANVTIEQLCCIAAFERIMRAMDAEVGMLRAISQNSVAEKLETAQRHLGKARAEYIDGTQSALVIASAGAIPDIRGKTH